MSEPEKRAKVCHIGAPAVFALGEACAVVTSAFDCYGCYVVGSSIERPDWRDVDVRCIMSDDAFRAEFPAVEHLVNASWEMDPKWVLLTVAISQRLAKLTDLPVDFQFQPASFANTRHKKARHAIGIR